MTRNGQSEPKTLTHKEQNIVAPTRGIQRKSARSEHVPKGSSKENQRSDKRPPWNRCLRLVVLVELKRSEGVRLPPLRCAVNTSGKQKEESSVKHE